MEPTFPFEGMLLFGGVSVLLLVGLILRAKVKFLQRFFVPACLIAGIIGFVARELLEYTGTIGASSGMLESFAYHLFNITFISLGLTGRPDSPRNVKQRLEGFKGITKMGLLIGTVAALQFTLGGALTMLFNVLGFNLFPTFGFLLPLGFEEGPGQALSIGKTWETSFGFTNGASIGLTFATFGFLFAIFVGVPLVSWGIRKGLAAHHDSSKIGSELRTGIYCKGSTPVTSGRLTTHSSSLDTLTMHAALIGFVYIISYGLIRALSMIVPSDIGEMLWGFFFVFGLLVSFLIRELIERLGGAYVLDNQTQSRLTGLGVDLLIVTSISAISLQVIHDYLAPLVIMAVSAGTVTLLWILYFGKRLWKNYHFERTVELYGMETGTVATGLVLIRLADPDFRTPAATDLAISSIIALFPLLAMFLLMNAPLLMGWSLGLTTLVFAAFIPILLILLKVFGLLHSPQQ